MKNSSWQNQPDSPMGQEKIIIMARESGWARPRERWLGGVCAALAEKTGWDVTIIRGVTVVLTLLFWFPVIFYAFGWLLIPDEQTGTVEAEKLFAGRFDGAQAVAAAMLFIGVFNPVPYIVLFTATWYWVIGAIVALTTGLLLYRIYANSQITVQFTETSAPEGAFPMSSPNEGPQSRPANGQKSTNPEAGTNNASPRNPNVSGGYPTAGPGPHSGPSYPNGNPGPNRPVPPAGNFNAGPGRGPGQNVPPAGMPTGPRYQQAPPPNYGAGGPGPGRGNYGGGYNGGGRGPRPPQNYGYPTPPPVPYSAPIVRVTKPLSNTVGLMILGLLAIMAAGLLFIAAIRTSDVAYYQSAALGSAIALIVIGGTLGVAALKGRRGGWFLGVSIVLSMFLVPMGLGSASAINNLSYVGENCSYSRFPFGGAYNCWDSEELSGWISEEQLSAGTGTYDFNLDNLQVNASEMTLDLRDAPEDLVKDISLDVNASKIDIYVTEDQAVQFYTDSDMSHFSIADGTTGNSWSLPTNQRDFFDSGSSPEYSARGEGIYVYIDADASTVTLHIEPSSESAQSQSGTQSEDQPMSGASHNPTKSNRGEDHA